LSNFDLSPWVESIAQSVQTGATYSRSFPITSPESCNAIGQRYFGPVVLITDAQCYSATDIFAAGFQDHKIGPILGVRKNTGAGGANVWTHQLLTYLLEGPESPFKPLPRGAGMRVAIRRTIRVGEQAGTPVEDFGVIPEYFHKMTRDDLINANVDLINHAAELLAQLPSRKFSVQIVSKEEKSLNIRVSTKNIDRLDIYMDKRPRESVNVLQKARTRQIRFSLPPEGAKTLEVRGYALNSLVAVKRISIGNEV
jgi:hypothetical protein